MIKTWKHKGLKLFFESGKTAGIQAKHASRLRIQLGALNSAARPEDLDLPGFNFHRLKGNKKGCFAVSVSGNWRLTYMFDGKDAILVNYEDYH